MKRKGIVLAGGSGTRLYPLTIAVSKQLMPVYDKPMIYYPLSVLMLANIRDILVISTPDNLQLFQRLLGDGSQFGVQFSYAAQPQPQGVAQAFLIGATFIANDPCALILGDNLFHGHSFTKSLRAANGRVEGATIFGCHVANPSAYGVVELAADRSIVSIEEKPDRPKSSYAVPGLYFYDTEVVDCASRLTPSRRGELEISDLNRCYLNKGKLHVELLGRGTAWLDTGSHDSLLDAAQFVQVIETRQGLKIACLEEIALHKGWIDRAQIEAQISRHAASSYATYLRGLVNDKSKR